MINLSPTDRKNQYQYSVKNNKLLAWIILITLSILTINIIGSLSVNSLNQQTSNYDQKITDTKQQYAQLNLGETQKQIQSMQNSINLANKVLSKEIQFSQVLNQITASIPSGAKLGSLNVNKNQGAIDINATAPDYNTATQLQINLSDKSNKVFSKADIVNISCKNSSSKNNSCSVTVRALFSKNNPYLISNKK